MIVELDFGMIKDGGDTRILPCRSTKKNVTVFRIHCSDAWLHQKVSMFFFSGF